MSTIFRIAAWTTVLEALGVAGHLSAAERPAAQPARPNVIIILADDLGFGDLGCHGHPKFKTPQIDRMAAEGARLTNFNTPMPFCAPTRASLLTGRYPFRCGLTSNPAPDGGPQADALALPAAEVTLAHVFRQAGYATGMVGKWHLGHQRPQYLPTHRGFDEYFGIPYSNDMRPVKLLAGEQTVEYPVVQVTLTRRYTEQALRFIERHKDRPFFFYFAHVMPHKPLAPAEEYYKKSEAGLYGDVIAELDGSVGRVLEKLKELQLDGRTLVLFSSDNGPWYGGSTGGLRGMKGSSFEGGYRVPLIARWPGRIPAGRVSHQPAIMMDLFATVLAAAGIPLPADRVIDGKDILPLFVSDAPSPHEVIFGHAGPRLATVRDARWKLHVLAPGGRKPPADEKWVDPRAPDGVTILAPYEQCRPSQYPGLQTGDPPKPMMLFDLEHDPGEQHDVAGEHPEVVARLKRAYDEMNKDVPAPAKPDRRASAGLALPSGIRLPEQWPPRLAKLDREPMPVPYLQTPPKVISIDVGRQLFVDDFLVETTTLQRTFHQAQYYAGNPVVRPDKPWEQEGEEARAMPFSDGVWHDPADGLLKMWYMSGQKAATAYATSRDGIHWEKPSLDVEPGTNVVLRQKRDSSTVWLDHREGDPARRLKMFIVVPKQGGGWMIALRCSPDGIHWSAPVATSRGVGDRTTVFFNPFRDVWVYSLRISYPGLPRSRAYQEHGDAAAGLGFGNLQEYLWVTSDRLDPANPDPEFHSITPQLYNLDAVAYESLLLGLFSVWQGPENGVCRQRGIQKRNEVFLGFSRDGFHWHRPDRRPFAGVNPTAGAWNWGNVQSVGGGCLVMDDRLYFYVSGRAIGQQNRGPWTSTGLALLRRDGFASLDAGEQEGTLTTRPVRFSGRHLFVNVAADQGELRAEVLDQSGRVIEPLRRERCQSVSVDKTLVEVRFNGTDLADCRGKPVRLRFYLRNGSLYSFWVSPDRSGASHGYLAAGGPGFSGPIDLQGSAAYGALP
jgi:arylsulfatase A-like enzyme